MSGKWQFFGGISNFNSPADPPVAIVTMFVLNELLLTLIERKGR